MDHWPKIVSLVELDPQALLTIGTYIVIVKNMYSLWCQMSL